MARQHDWLLSALEKRGLKRRVAFWELVNELDYTPIWAPLDPSSVPLTYANWAGGQQPKSDPQRLRRICGEALAFLQKRHPDVLFTVDFGAAAAMPSLLPQNAQIADHHAYAGIFGVYEAAGVSGWTAHQARRWTRIPC